MNERRRIIGVVTSNKMQKTVSVKIDRKFKHPVYQKIVNTSKNVLAHDEMGCQIGDRVVIVESQPLSRRKQWVVQEILRRESVELDLELGAKE